MALINCRECGNQISDSAVACPRCGVAAPGGNCALVFTRPSLARAAVHAEVHVDGYPYGSLRAHGRIVVPVTPGSHHVEVRTNQGKSGVTTVTVSGGDTELKVGLGLMGSPKFR
ncbi:zinc-ribbon domain-containing protein [Leekyejoonella antrihumi]|uniref:Zinc-ribbon domain-containing protein n=1 Tax=Leekyejoonella antrihumi TaxID=1660198 RepID=A0A563DST4_9MICO|nr:zinc-ribbon domain-containing protein [Leekyejoonella antrihumi]TWP33002.1 zinc-ribbon domain-containing protein [Leekyejoonella antrihumi]